MAVLPKYQLKLLFEAGDLITQDTLNDFIDSSYNPTLVAGTGISLSTVSTPSGTTITINGSATGVTSLTTTGTSGPATLSGGVLNIPVYSSGGAGGAFTNSTPTPAPFPGNSPFDTIPAGSTFSNESFSDMMNKMLYPTLYPTLINPSHTFTLSQAGFLEVNETTPLNFSSTFNRGSINPAYSGGPSLRSGLPNTYVYNGTGVSSNPSSSLSDTETVASYTVLIGTQSWTGAVAYDAGQQPLDSDGNNFNSPLPAGTTSTITRSITGVYPVFATTILPIGTLQKQALQSMTTYIQVSLVPEQLLQPDRQAIEVPNAWATITGAQIFNSVSGTWDPLLLSTFTTSATTQVIQGNTINYTRYENNVGFPRGATQIRLLT